MTGILQGGDGRSYQGPGEGLIADLTTKAEKIASRRLDELKRKYSDFAARLRRLQDEKHAINRQPLTNDELARRAKEALKKGKANVLVDALRFHFEKCQNNRSLPMDERSMRLLFGREDAWRMVYAVTTTRDIDRAIAQLPDDVGVSQEEREAALAKIDAEIKDIEAKIEKEFQELGGDPAEPEAAQTQEDPHERGLKAMQEVEE